MLITSIKDIDKKKKLVYIDYQIGFALYNREISVYKIYEGQEINENTLNQVSEVLYNRCINRISYILIRSDKSEHDLREKLRNNYYPDDIIEKAVSHYKEYGYLNDEEYASNYIQHNIPLKSKRRIYTGLLTRGISKELIEKLMDSFFETPDNEEYQRKLIEKEFVRKKFDFTNSDSLENKYILNKIISSLVRRGFNYDDILSTYYQLKQEC